MKVIGGGPIGLWTAKLLADKGFEVTIFEEHKEVGNPEHCTGLFSRNLDKIIKPNTIQFVNGARFFAGSKKAIIEKKKVARVSDRKKFDKQILEEALSSGVNLVHKRANWKDFEGTIIAADGASSKTRRDLGQSIKFLPALQFDVKAPTGDMVELWFEKWNPNYFIWVVPRGDSVRVGTASRNLKPLKAWVKKRFPSAKITGQNAGLVITSGMVNKLSFHFPKKDVYLVGDAAGQVKPTTGGGVYTSLTCSHLLVENIINGNYEKACKKQFGREFQIQRVARWAMMRNPQGFVKLLNKNKLIFETEGDMDHQSLLAPKLLWDGFWWIFGAIFK